VAVQNQARTNALLDPPWQQLHRQALGSQKELQGFPAPGFRVHRIAANIVLVHLLSVRKTFVHLNGVLLGVWGDSDPAEIGLSLSSFPQLGKEACGVLVGLKSSACALFSSVFLTFLRRAPSSSRSVIWVRWRLVCSIVACRNTLR
jgi:hypothetical protein